MANKYIALLRGINISGQKLIEMKDLKESFENLKFRDVITYVQSGNVVFQAPGFKEVALVSKIEKMILKDFGFKVPVMVRSSHEIQEVFKTNPFLKKKDIDISRLYVTFTSQEPDKKPLKSLEKYITQNEEFKLIGREFFLHFPNSYGKTKLNNNIIEKVMSVSATTRNWNTVTQLAESSR